MGDLEWGVSGGGRMSQTMTSERGQKTVAKTYKNYIGGQRGGWKKGGSLTPHQPAAQGPGAGRDAGVQRGRRQRRPGGGAKGVSRLAAHARARSRRDRPQGRPDPRGAQRRAGPADDAGDGQSPQRGTR